MALKRDLIDMANDGYFDNWPDVKARVLSDYNPLVELAIAGLIAPGDSQRIIANKIVFGILFRAAQDRRRGDRRQPAAHQHHDRNLGSQRAAKGDRASARRLR